MISEELRDEVPLILDLGVLTDCKLERKPPLLTLILPPVLSIAEALSSTCAAVSSFVTPSYSSCSPICILLKLTFLARPILSEPNPLKVNFISLLAATYVSS